MSKLTTILNKVKKTNTGEYALFVSRNSNNYYTNTANKDKKAVEKEAILDEIRKLHYSMQLLKDELIKNHNMTGNDIMDNLC